MSYRKILYGYQIQNGELTLVPEEAAVVNRIAGLYLDGLSYQKLADLLNQKNIPFSQEAPAWDKHKVKRLLENPRYTGQKGYPAILDGGTFHCVQSRIQEKTAKQTPKAERPALKLVSRLHCAACGAALHRMGGRNRQSDTLYITEQIDRPLDVCLDHIRLAVSHINLSEEGTVEAAFPSGHRERTEHGADCTAAGADHPRQEGY